MHAPLALSQAEAGYDGDFYLWTMEQARLLRASHPDGIDWENVAEEIETLGNELVRELGSRLTVIVEHMLKYQHGMNRDPAGGWEETLLEQRQRIDDLFDQSPSLRRKIERRLDRSYGQGRRKALASFKVYEPSQVTHYRKALPDALPYTVEQLLDEDYLPEPDAA